MSRSRGLRLTLPILFMVPLVWLMVGCHYLPSWERVQLRGTKRDFRDLTGPVVGQDRPIVAGRVTRRQVESLLGPPPYASVDGRSAVYMLTTRHGLWVVPLCLAAGSGSESQVAVRLEYGADGVLLRYRLATASHELQNPIRFIGDGVNPSEEYEDEPAVALLNAGDLRPTAAAPPPPFPEHAWMRQEPRLSPSDAIVPPATRPTTGP